MSENFRRIADGLKEAAIIAACSHPFVLPFEGRWHCPDCGGQFNRNPVTTPSQHISKPTPEP